MLENISPRVSVDEASFDLKKPSWLRLVLEVMRPHQWTKNLFIFAPLLFGRKLTELNAVIQATLAFATFCCLASSIYIFNDWIDAESDRAHPEKQNRPISSGALSVTHALTVATLLVLIGGFISFAVGATFMAIATLYTILMIVYCLSLKRMIVLDGMTIATGFVLRVVAGAFAVNVITTHWLIACTFLLALYLAFTKRRQELLSLSNGAAGHRQVLGSYSVAYLEQVNTILICAAIVCYALYTVAPETVLKFGTDGLIYGTVFVIYGMFRYLALTNDKSMGGNPSKVLLTDAPLLLTISGWAIFNALVIYQSSFSDIWESLSR